MPTQEKFDKDYVKTNLVGSVNHINAAITHIDSVKTSDEVDTNKLALHLSGAGQGLTESAAHIDASKPKAPVAAAGSVILDDKKQPVAAAGSVILDDKKQPTGDGVIISEVPAHVVKSILNTSQAAKAPSSWTKWAAIGAAALVAVVAAVAYAHGWRMHLPA